MLRMTEIFFYHLQSQSLEAALPQLLEKSLERNWRVVIQAKSDERLEALDQWLWVCSDASFLAHGQARDGDAELQPIYLSTGIENPNGAQVRFFVEGALIAPALAEPCAYLRAIALFDGANEDELAQARAQWRALKDVGHAPTYWRQNDGGRWEKKS